MCVPALALLVPPAQTPRFQVRENNWAVNYRFNKVFLTYDL
jgi:hypothetical protein